MLWHVCLSTNTLYKQINIKHIFKTLQKDNSLTYVHIILSQVRCPGALWAQGGQTWDKCMGTCVRWQEIPKELHWCTWLLAAECVSFPTTSPEGCVTDGFLTLSGFHQLIGERWYPGGNLFGGLKWWLSLAIFPCSHGTLFIIVVYFLCIFSLPF